MKSILVFVATLDGKVTKWGDPFVRQWSSKEDQAYFSNIWTSSRLIVMGSSTYDVYRPSPTPRRHVIIMTKDPEKYKEQEVFEQLEFSEKSPAHLTSALKKKGYKQMLLIGGPHIATSFIKEQLVDELWLTIEPRIFGSGGSFVIEEELDINLRLISCDKVNEQGTLITKYSVVKK